MGNALTVCNAAAIKIDGRTDERARRRALAAYRTRTSGDRPMKRRRFVIDARLQRARNAATHVDLGGDRSFRIMALGAEEVSNPASGESSWHRRRWWIREPPSTWLWIQDSFDDPNLLYECPERIEKVWPVYAALRQSPLVWRLVAPSSIEKSPSALAHDLWRHLGVVHVDDADVMTHVVDRLRKRLPDADDDEIAHMASRCIARAATFVPETVPLYDECAGIGTVANNEAAGGSLVDFADADVVVYHDAVPAALRNKADASSSTVCHGAAMHALASQLRHVVGQYCLEHLIPLKRLHRSYWAYCNGKAYTPDDLDLWTILRAADWLEFWAARGYGFRAGHV